MTFPKKLKKIYFPTNSKILSSQGDEKKVNLLGICIYRRKNKTVDVFGGLFLFSRLNLLFKYTKIKIHQLFSFLHRSQPFKLSVPAL